jgi:2-methylisocitrate lyase-like PEP mutase family enzyme
VARPESRSAQLQRLIHRKDKVLAIMHPPTAALARIMEAAGCEAGFVGTGGVVGGYTGYADVGAITLMECVQVAGWIAQSVRFPVMMDGIRLDDQPLEGKRKTQSAGMEVVPLDQAIARYRAAVDMKNELDPDFVIMAQCYARDAANSSLDDCIARLKAYREVAGVDWVQLESPHSIDEIKLARAAVEGPLSFMKGKLPRYLDLDEHLALGINIAWYPTFTHHVIRAALWEFMQDFQSSGVAAWDDFVAQHKDRPYPVPEVGPDGDGLARQQELEQRYFSAAMLKKYES